MDNTLQIMLLMIYYNCNIISKMQKEIHVEVVKYF